MSLTSYQTAPPRRSIYTRPLDSLQALTCAADFGHTGAMYVEDLIRKIRDHLACDIPPVPNWFGGNGRNRPMQAGILEGWAADFVQSVGNHIDNGRALSVKQAAQVLKVIERVRHHIVTKGWATDDQITAMILHPQYRQPLYEASYVPREVRYLGGNLIAFRFRGDKELIDKITALSQAPMTPWLHGGVVHGINKYELEREATVAIKSRYDYLYKIKVVPVYRFNLKAITDIIATHRFKTDDMILAYFRGARKNLDEPAVVTISKEDEAILVKVHDDPLLSSWITEIGEGLAI